MTCDVLFTFHYWVCVIGSQGCSLNKTLMAWHFLRMNYQKISHCTRQLNTLPQPVFTVFFNIVTSHWEDRLISMQQTINFMYIEPLRSISLSLSLSHCVCVCVCLSALLCVWVCAHLLYKRSEQKHMGCVGVFWQRTATLPPLQQNQETLHFVSASKILGMKTQIVMNPLQSRRILWRGVERHTSYLGLLNTVQPPWLLTLHRVGRKSTSDLYVIGGIMWTKW